MTKNQNTTKSDGMYNRILKLPLEGKSSVFLFGPRGTGKTSWIKSHLPDALYFDLLNYGVYSSLKTKPQKLASVITPNYDGWIVIDEVQMIPELLNEVHRLIESRKLRFLLTGSSARSLRKAGVNLLAGRALTYNMHPLVIQEIGSSFNLNHSLQFGMLPAVVNHEDPQKYLESYVKTYIREEVLQEGLTRNIGAFTQFLEAASFSQGQVINCSEIARELSINRLIVTNYFDILNDLLIASRLEPFKVRAKRQSIAHNKFYFFDCGVYRTVRPHGLLDSTQEAEGSTPETLFLQSLQAINDYFNLGYKIYFWRTLAGNEVDFVLYGPRGLHAFEIKRSSTVTSDALKGLKSFQKDYPEAKTYLINTGALREYHGSMQVIPIEQALWDLPKILE